MTIHAFHLFLWGMHTAMISYIVCLPLVLCLYLTCPDRHKEKHKRVLLDRIYQFHCSEIAIFAYFMVWFAVTIGWFFSVPEVIMGLYTPGCSALASPIFLSSVIASRGKVWATWPSLASIGSNIFDILIGLPFLGCASSSHQICTREL